MHEIARRRGLGVHSSQQAKVGSVVREARLRYRLGMGFCSVEQPQASTSKRPLC